MSIGFGTAIYMGAGTLASTTGALTITHSNYASQFAYGLNIAVMYMVYSATPIIVPYCTNAPWVLLAYSYDPTTMSAIAVFGMVSPRYGAVSSTFQLCTTNNVAATIQSASFIVPSGFSGTCVLAGIFLFALSPYDLGRCQLVSASSTTLTVPSMAYPYPQGLEIACGGYNNAGTTTTIGVCAQGGGQVAFTERFDTGQVSPPHGVFLDNRIITGGSLPPIASANASLTVAKTNKWGARVFIPIVANSMGGSRRYMSNRRLF